MIIVFIPFIVVMLICTNNYIVERYHRIFMYLMLLGFSIYSGIGIILNQDKLTTPVLYFLQFMLFIIVFFFIVYISQYIKETSLMAGANNICYSKLTLVFTIVYLSTFIYQLIFSGITINSIWDFINIFVNYRATTFSVRVARKSSIVYTIMTNQVRSISAPFFYLYLYKNRDKRGKFIGLFLFPILLKTIADGYLSRNNIAIYAAFIFVYLVKEGRISKRAAKAILIVSIPFVLFLFSFMSDIRYGTTSQNGFLSSIIELIKDETSYPQYYDYCNNVSDDVGVINYIIYIFIVCIPSQLYSSFGFTTPNLAYTFTEAVTGLGYAETNNYYILLPSVLGEGIMLFGKYFSFMYALVYGIISTWFLRLLKSQECFSYLLIFYLLDFFRQFRGGSQYVISGWETQLMPFMIILLIYNSVTVRSAFAETENEGYF